jgi:Fur family peroxide stress response transcriptional regulator
MSQHPSNTPQNRAAAAPLALGPEFRLTKQRREVYDVLKEQLDHPTATEVFIRAKERVPGISLATVYNCLETLTHSGLVKQVNLDRGPSRYCPNLKEHGHFYCESCGHVTDVELRDGSGSALALPRGSVVNRMDISLRGLCPACAKAAKQKEKARA